jgi:hypothetical protein
MAIGTPPGPTPPLAAGSVGAGVQAQPQVLGEVVVEQVPERLARISRNIVLTGTVAEQRPGGALVVRTPAGEMVIRSQIVLPTDKLLSIQIPPGAPPVRAVVSVLVPVVLPAASPAIPAGAIPTPAAIAPPAGVPPATASVITQPISTPTPQAAALLSAAMGVELQLATPPQIGSVLQAVVQALPMPTQVPSQLAITQLLQTLAPAAAQQGAQQGLQAQPIPQSGAQPLIQPQAPSPAQLLPTSVAQAPSVVAGLGASALQTVNLASLASVLSAVATEAAPTPLPPSVALPVAPKAAPTVSVPAPASSPSPSSSPVSPTAVPPSPQGFINPSLMAEPAFQALPQLLALPPGSQALVQISAIQLPQQQSTAAHLPAASNAASAPVSTAPAIAPTTPAASTVAAPQSAPAPAPAAPPPITFPAIVVGHLAHGEALVTSPVGLLVVGSDTYLPTQTKLQLSLVHVDEPVLRSAQGEANLPQPPKDWPGMTALLSMFGPHTTGQTNLFSSSKPEAFGAAFLFLLTALRLNTPKALIRDGALQAVQQAGGQELLARIAQELQQASGSWQRSGELGSAQQQQAAAASDWRSLSLPLLPDGQLSRLAVHTRREGEDGSQGQQNGARHNQRFVVEVELSRLGPLVLDGLIARERFTLTVRSQHSLPVALRQEITQVFGTSIDAIGWKGQISFTSAAEIWLQF